MMPAPHLDIDSVGCVRFLAFRRPGEPQRGLNVGVGAGYIRGDHYVPVQVRWSTVHMWPEI